MAGRYRPENPELPTLDPWLNTTAPPSEQFVFVRNPYFHRVDPEGRQLPYIDRIVLSIELDEARFRPRPAPARAICRRAISSFDDYTFLKEAEKLSDHSRAVVGDGQGSRVALFPNLNFIDPVWRKIRDVRFRRALSLAIDRNEINRRYIRARSTESADTVLPRARSIDEEYATAWANFDPAAANALLDEIGLISATMWATRLLPDGRPAEHHRRNGRRRTEETDVLELVTDIGRRSD